MPRAFLVKKPCVSTCKRNWSELPDEERGEIYVPGEAAGARGAGGRRAGRRDAWLGARRRDAGMQVPPAAAPLARGGPTPGERRGVEGGAGGRSAGWGRGRAAAGGAGEAAGCVTAPATVGSRVVNPESRDFLEARGEHWSDATGGGQGSSWSLGCSLRSKVREDAEFKQLHACPLPHNMVASLGEGRGAEPPSFPEAPARPAARTARSAPHLSLRQRWDRVSLLLEIPPFHPQ